MKIHALPLLTSLALLATLLAAHRARADVTAVSRDHLDLRAVYTASGTNHLSLVAVDEDAAAVYTADECVLVVADGARVSLPAGTPFGNEGDPLYVLPQSENPDLLYLGLSAEDVPDGVFAGDLRFRLVAMTGPGNLFVWRASAPGVFEVAMSTADGIDAGDGTGVLAGGHKHLNYGFTAPGVYRVTLRVSGRPAGEAADLESPDATFEFQVLPLPVVPTRLRVAGHDADGGLRIEVSGTPGTACTVESSTDLATWSPLQEVPLVRSTATIGVPASGAGRFFRAVVH